MFITLSNLEVHTQTLTAPSHGLLCLSTVRDIWSFSLKVHFLESRDYAKPRFSFSNPPDCRENLASMNDKADERRQHIKKDPVLFSQTFFLSFFILLVFVQELDTL